MAVVIRAGTVVETRMLNNSFGMEIQLDETDEKSVTFIVSNPDALTDEKDIYVVAVDPHDQFCHVLTDTECDRIARHLRGG